MRAAIYARISRDTAGEGLGVERQLEDCREHAERLGWQVIDEHVDNDASASSAHRKPRPGYEALLASAISGHIDAVIAYSNSRLTRRPLELEEWITLSERTGVRISTVVSGEDDLSKADGQMIARIKASIDAGEAKRTSERLTRQKADRASRGLPQGGRYRNFGYSREYEVIENEAVLVKEMFTRRAAEQSLTSIAKDLADRGHATASGASWSASAVGKMLTRPIYCGLRSLRGEIIGKSTAPAIIDEPLWRAAQAVGKAAPAGTNARRWLLSGIARCGKCSAAMVGNASKAGYRCHQVHGGCGGIRVKAVWLEDPIVSLMLARETARVGHPRPAGPSVDSGATLAKIDREIEEARALFKVGDLALADLAPILRDLRAGRAEAEQRAAVHATAQATGSVLTNYGWVDMNLSERRALIGRHIDSVVVGPRTTKGPGRFEPERYTVRWTDGTTQHVTQDDLDRIPTRHSELGLWRYPRGTARILLPPMRFSS